ELAFVHQKTLLRVQVRQRGLAGRKIKLALFQDDQELDNRTVVLSKEELVEVAFTVQQDKEGQYRYEVKAEPVPGELSLANNADLLVLTVVDEPVRVLLLEGRPYWDSKFLMRTLSQDPSIELDGLIRMGEDRFYHR